MLKTCIIIIIIIIIVCVHYKPKNVHNRTESCVRAASIFLKESNQGQTGRQGKQQHSKFSGRDIKLLCRLRFELVWGRVFDFFVITIVGFGYFRKIKIKESLLVLGI
jgi:hypothetical protein